MSALILSAVISLSFSSLQASATGIESDKTFQQSAPQRLEDFSFSNSSARDIAQTFAALFKKELLMDRADDIKIDLPKHEPDTVGNAWSRFVAALQARGLTVSGNSKAIHIYRSGRKKEVSTTPATKPDALKEQALSSSRVVPRFENGKPIGFDLIQIQTGSIFEKMGFKNRDIITEINGRFPVAPEEELTTIFKNKSSNKVTIQILRNGKKKTLSYELK